MALSMFSKHAASLPRLGRLAGRGAMRMLPTTARSPTELLTPAQVEQFHTDGFVRVKCVLSEAEISDFEKIYLRFLAKDIPVPSSDYGDMSQPMSTPQEQFNMINVMIPRYYHPKMQGNVFEQRCAAMTRQLFGDGMCIDYDQILAKKPNRPNAVFPWHQDMGYWWDHPTIPTRTATFSLALSAAGPAEGCLRVIPGSHKDAKLRRHATLDNAEKASASTTKAMVLEPRSGEDAVHVPVERADVTIHNEWVVHGSGGNNSSKWRHTYVLAFRDTEMVNFERQMGFKHSYADTEALHRLRQSKLDARH